MRRRPSIRTYIILMNMLLLCLLFPSISFLTLRATSTFRDEQLARTIELLEEALINRGTALARNLSLNTSQAVAGYDFSSILNLLRQATENDPDMLHSLIISQGGEVLADHEQEGFGKFLDSGMDKKTLEIAEQEFSTRRPPDTILLPVVILRNLKGMDPTLIEVIAPVYNGEQLWGILRCIFSRQTLEQEISLTRQKWTERMQSFSIYLFSMVCLFFLLGVAVIIYFSRPILAALLSLGRGVERISNGDLQHTIRKENLACREFVELASSFNNMTSFLRDSRQQLAEYNRSLENKVESRTKELKQAHETLLKQAHEAGMAEMAVGVLHNIGNAITPAKVGTAMVLKRLQESPLRQGLAPALVPLIKIIDQADLAEAECQRLHAILELLPRSIQEEYSQLIEEISQIREKHEHIEAIISLQMRYARLLGQAEPVDINRVVRDALDMLSDSISKRNIEVELHLTEVPSVQLEKAKLIQVIVNIIKNGYEAIDQNQGGEKRITISSSLADTKKPAVLLLIEDTGCGFLSSDEENLFSFGYSSKKRGTGFGLHSCANYLIANHGSIIATSKGAGQGAIFSLTLPTTQDNTSQDKEKHGL